MLSQISQSTLIEQYSLNYARHPTRLQRLKLCLNKGYQTLKPEKTPGLYNIQPLKEPLKAPSFQIHILYGFRILSILFSSLLFCSLLFSSLLFSSLLFSSLLFYYLLFSSLLLYCFCSSVLFCFNILYYII